MSQPPTRSSLTALAGVLLAGACAEDVPPPSVDALIEDPIRLEAILVRCAENRAETRYEAECVNARQAVALMEARQEEARRKELEARSEMKREALRRTQEAAAEARRRAAEAERLRQEAEYLAQFGELPPPDETGADSGASDELEGNVPGAVITESDSSPVPVIGDPLSATDGGNAPGIEIPEPATDLDAVRDELRRRADPSQ